MITPYGEEPADAFNPVCLKDRQIEAMQDIFKATCLALSFGRKVPVLREELNVDKKTLRELEDIGLIRQQTVYLIDHKAKKNRGARASLWLSGQGHAYLRETHGAVVPRNMEKQ